MLYRAKEVYNYILLGLYKSLRSIDVTPMFGIGLRGITQLTKYIWEGLIGDKPFELTDLLLLPGAFPVDYL